MEVVPSRVTFQERHAGLVRKLKDEVAECTGWTNKRTANRGERSGTGLVAVERSLCRFRRTGGFVLLKRE
jgi:hypothetical protein